MKRLHAPLAWVDGRWQRDVLLTVDASGHWAEIAVNAELPPDAERLAGPLIPSLVNAHSHAFQRAFVGLAERREAGQDDFWSWRDRMYSVARRITPEQLEAIASLLYAELLAGGYTQVCEFHYLHNGLDGAPYADPLAMSLALVRAAQRVGMGLTLLPTLYMRSGFGAAGLREDQARFATTPDSVLRLVDGVQRQTGGLPTINVGVAIHSLRAADEGAIKEVASFAASAGLPIHIHIAEQTQEVQDCLAHTGQRPFEWLLNHLPLNAHWNLVHATHTTPAELNGVRDSGAAIVICPSTEANLGDGVFDYGGFAGLKGRWSIGSDSHVTRHWAEELRLLEYSQRLTQRRRNVAAQIGGNASTAATLFEAALAGGSPATGRPHGAIESGHRADFLVLDGQSCALLGVPFENVLDALVFSSPAACFKDVFVAGRPVAAAEQGGATRSEADGWPRLAEDFARTMTTLWG